MSTYPRTPSPTNAKHSLPIPIAGGHHGRSRSDSSATGYSSSSSDGSPVRTPPRPTLNMTMPTVAAPPSAGTSPTSPLFTFLRAGAGQSPPIPTAGKAPIAYPFTTGSTRGPLSALDDEEASVPEHAASRHARRASLAGTLPARFPTAAAAAGAPSVVQTERGAGVLRRLSLGGAFGRPQIPVKPPTPPARTTTPPGLSTSAPSAAAAAPATPEPPRVPRTKRRSATLGVDAQRPPRRAPSPMGERILKGHFDSFH